MSDKRLDLTTLIVGATGNLNGVGGLDGGNANATDNFTDPTGGGQLVNKNYVDSLIGPASALQQLTQAQEDAMTFADGDVWYNTTSGQAKSFISGTIAYINEPNSVITLRTLDDVKPYDGIGFGTDATILVQANINVDDLVFPFTGNITIIGISSNSSGLFHLYDKAPILIPPLAGQSLITIRNVTIKNLALDGEFFFLDNPFGSLIVNECDFLYGKIEVDNYQLLSLINSNMGASEIEITNVTQALSTIETDEASFRPSNNVSLNLNSATQIPKVEIRGSFGVVSQFPALYVATDVGTAVSTDNGATFNNLTTSNGLLDDSTDTVAIYKTAALIGSGTGLNFINTINSAEISSAKVYNTVTDASPLGLGNFNAMDVYLDGTDIYVCTTSDGILTSERGDVWSQVTTANGLASNNVRSIKIDGTNWYVATDSGLSISTDSGVNWTTINTGNSALPSDNALCIDFDSTDVYAATSAGVVKVAKTDVDIPANWTLIDSTNSTWVQVVPVPFSPSEVYLATSGSGLLKSTDAGASFSTLATTAQGIGSNFVRSILVSNNNVYACTAGGFSISSDNGANFSNKTTVDGLGSNSTRQLALTEGAAAIVENNAGVSQISVDQGTYQGKVFVNFDETSNNSTFNKVIIDGVSTSSNDNGIALAENTSGENLAFTTIPIALTFASLYSSISTVEKFTIFDTATGELIFNGNSGFYSFNAAVNFERDGGSSVNIQFGIYKFDGVSAYNLIAGSSVIEEALTTRNTSRFSKSNVPTLQGDRFLILANVTAGSANLKVFSVNLEVG